MEPVAIVADVTTLETRDPVHPQQVALLEARGFRVLGRFATMARPSRDDIAFGGSERARLDEWRQRPAATVLVAPDDSAFASVDTFGDARLLRLRTELDDASVVETVGVDEEGVLRPRLRGNPLGTFAVARTSDHSVLVVPDPTPDHVIAAHADHVEEAAARRGARPVRHTDRDHALRLATLHADHVSRVMRRWQNLIRAVGIAVLLVVGLAFAWLEIANGIDAGLALALDLVMVVVAAVVLVAVLTPFRYVQWWRPPYLVHRRGDG